MFYCPLGLNLTMVFAAALASIAFGGVWYTVFFGKAWAAALGKTKDQLGNPWTGLAVMFVSTLVTAMALNFLILYLDITRISGGLKLGLLAGLGFTAAAILTNDAYEGRPARLSFINIGYQLISIILMSVLLAKFR